MAGQSFQGKSLSVFWSFPFILSSDPWSTHQAVGLQVAEMPKKERTYREPQSQCSFKIQINPGTTECRQSLWGNYHFSVRIKRKKKKDVKRVKETEQRGLWRIWGWVGREQDKEILGTHWLGSPKSQRWILLGVTQILKQSTNNLKSWKH